MCITTTTLNQSIKNTKIGIDLRVSLSRCFVIHLLKSVKTLHCADQLWGGREICERQVISWIIEKGRYGQDFEKAVVTAV